jgi:prepilin-type processing-associated H-X9-DG protein
LNSFPTNYGVNVGNWVAFDPTGALTPTGAFFNCSKLKPASFIDGMSKTVMVSEIKMWTSSWSGGTAPSTPPTNPGDICTYSTSVPKAGPAYTSNTAHTEWGDGKVIQSGFTSTFAPNTFVGCMPSAALLAPGGATYDFDYVSVNESSATTVPSYAAVTSRSYHTGVVNAAMMDGSVRTVSDEIVPAVWQAICSRAGSETVSPTDW